MPRKLWISLSLLTFLSGLALPVRADDWPQWMGPGRDNVWRETGLIEKFPEGGPPVRWRTPVARGYAGPAVAAGRVVISDYLTEDQVPEGNWDRKSFSGLERIHCLDATTGESVWKHEYPVKYSISYPGGPRCTPLIEGGRVTVLGAEGRLTCLSLEKGEVIWEKELNRDYASKSALWGYASHPLIDGDRLIVIVGGEGTHVVAFHKATGEEIWRSLSSDPEQKGYSPPSIATIHGVRQLIIARPQALEAVSPEDGKKLWSIPYQADNGSLIMTPVVWNDHVFIAGYNNRNLMVRLEKDPLRPVKLWQNKAKWAMSPVNVQPFRIENTLYGFDQKGFLHAMDLPSGERLWQSTGPIDGGRRSLYTATAFLVRQADRFWMFNERGELVIAKLSREGYEEIDRAKLLEPTGTAMGRAVVWSMPAFANRRAYLRNDREIICVDLAADAKPSS